MDDITEQDVARVLISVITVQFFISTGHVVSLLIQLIRGFVYPPSPPPANALPPMSVNLTGSALYFTDQSTPEHIAEVTLYVLNVSKAPHRMRRTELIGLIMIERDRGLFHGKCMLQVVMTFF